MSRLILVRHAKSDWDDPALDDFDRPLNRRGRGDAPRIGAWLFARKYLAEQALVSPAKRALQTFARLYHGATPPPARFPEALYLAEPETLLRALRGAEAATVLMIGHNPGIGGFARRLLAAPPVDAGFHQYPTCATAVIDFDGDWSAADWGEGVLEAFATPKRLG